MTVGLVRALVLSAVVLLGAVVGTVVGAWLSSAATYLVTEPAERTIPGAAFAAVLVLLVLKLALLARWVYGTTGLAAFATVVLLGAILAGLAVL